jgi:hypothetical protein
MANKFVGFLEAVGRDFKKLLPFAQAGVEAFFPAASPLFNLVTNQAIVAEQNFAAIGQQSGTGSQKLAAVTAAIGNTLKQALADAGKPNSLTDVQNFISAVVTILNTTPAVLTTTSTATATTTATA